MSSSSPRGTAVETGSPDKRFTFPLCGIVSSSTVGVLVAATDAMMILACGWLGQLLDAVAGRRHAADWDAVVGIALFASVLFTILSRLAGLYTLPSLLHPARMLKGSLLLCGLVVASLAALAVIPKVGDLMPRGLLIGTASAIMVICGLARFAIADVLETLMARGAIAGRRAFLIGDAAEMETLSTPYLLSEFGLQDAGRLALRLGPDEQPAWAADEVAAALEAARVEGVEEFVVIVSGDRWAHLPQIATAFRASPLPVRLMPPAAYRSILGRSRSFFGTGACLAELQAAPLGPGDRTAKRVLDVMVASLALVGLLPVMMLAAAAIKLDSPGPIVFRQRRNGFDQRQFTIFKFRTMHVLDDGPDVRQAQRGDARVTRVGAFLRRTSIDELPQLLNVLRGDMSLVGPRPHALSHDKAFTASIGNYSMRHRVKPGITGWAQISGCRGETACAGLIERRVECDLWYINHWSLRLDFAILLRTAVDVVHHDAY